MRTETRTVRIGERVSDIDWSYDFRSHFDSMGCSVERRDERCAERVAQLGAVEAAFREGRKVEVTTDGGWPRVGWGVVLDVGMYDGWPYWRPVPCVLKTGTFGGEWCTFDRLDAQIESPPTAAGIDPQAPPSDRTEKDPQ